MTFQEGMQDLQRRAYDAIINSIVNSSIVTSTTDYSVYIDESSTYTYIGKALPGTLTSASAWKICRITNATGVLLWADSVSTFSKVWDNRASYTYG